MRMSLNFQNHIGPFGSKTRRDRSPMIIIGINSSYHESSAAVVIDGQLVAAAEEERFNRVKHGKLAQVDNADILPWQALAFCLKTAGIRREDINHITYSFDPWVRWKHLRPDVYTTKIRAGDFGTPEGEAAFLRSNLRAKEQLHAYMPYARFHFLSHHLCHAASAFFVSPFREAGILVVDGIAEVASTWAGCGSQQTIENLFEVEYPHSLGFLWEKMCEFLGFDRYDGPGMVMALATTARPRSEHTGIDYRERFQTFVQSLQDGGFCIDPHVLRYRLQDYSGLKTRLGLEPSRHDSPIERAAIAAGLQAVTEDILVHIATHLYRRINTGRDHKITDLCLAGGVALNCVANTEILKRTPWKRIWVQPAAHDAGTALGAALVLWNLELGHRERIEFPDAYWGPEFSEAEYEMALQRAALPFKRPHSLAKKVAALLDEGRIVAWFQGRMEFGPRALGNRSIVADLRRVAMRTILNHKVKDREEFRPFAPSVLESHAARYFDVPFLQTGGETTPCHFMLATVPVKTEAVSSLPAVIQENQSQGQCSSRIHVVSDNVNPAYQELLEEFCTRSGYAAVLNTSFNISEPIVCSPEQAVATFQQSSLDALVLGPYLVERP